MTRQILNWLLATAFLATASLAQAQKPTKVYRIGYIHLNPPEEIAHLTKAFEDGLQGLGYNEGRNLVLERRNANGQQERLPSVAVELVRLTPDVIVSGGNNPVIAAIKAATRVIPVVMAVSRDPVGAGFVESLAHPGGNITGLSNDPTPEIIGRNLELLKETIPRFSRVSFFLESTAARLASL